MTVSTIAAATIVPGHARAQSADGDVAQLRQQLRVLQQRLDQLERSGGSNATVRRAAADAEAARRQAAAAQAEAAAARQQVEAAQAHGALDTAVRVNAGGDDNRPLTLGDLRGSLPNSFRIPGTDTSVRLYGFVKLNMSGDLGPRNRSDTITGQSLPLSHGPNNSRTGGDFQASARRTRVGIESLTPFGDAGDLRIQIEGDLAGQNTDLTTQGTGNAYTPRLRQAWAEFGRLQGWGTILAGQANSLWNDSEYGAIAGIQQLTDWTAPTQSAVRQAQLRYSKGFGPVIVQLSIENSYSDVTSASTTLAPDAAANGGAGWAANNVPDFLARVTYRGDTYWADVRGMVREIRLDNDGATAANQRFTETATGWGMGVSGGIRLLDNRLVLFAQAHWGDGIGRYLDATSNGFGAVTNAGMAGVTPGQTKLNTVRVLAGNVGAAYYFTPTFRTNLWLAGAHLGYPSYVEQFGACAGTTAAGTCNTVNRSMWATTVNLIWSPIPRIDVGIEWQHAVRTLEARNTDGALAGTADRIQAAVIARF
ncbi:MAG TPA: hypothetical protein VGM87_21550 [Roseomonas sp.]